VDFTEFNFTRHLLSTLEAAGAEKFEMVKQELREAWVARMKMLVAQIDSPVVLLWLSDHSPEECTTCSSEAGDPLFVDRAMLREVEPFIADLVEVVVDPGDRAEGLSQMIFADLDEPAARGMLGAVAHARAAAALTPALERLL